MIAPVDPLSRPSRRPAPTTCWCTPEAGPHLHRTLQLIRSHGKRAGVVLNPATPPEAVAWVLDLVDIVLVMTVNPGFGGQAFLHSQLPKIAAVRRMIDASRPSDRAVGGWRRSRPRRRRGSIDAGADTLVAGTAVFRRDIRLSRRRSAALRGSGTVGMNATDPRRWLRDARRAIARLPSLRMGRVPDAPALPVRDPWPGDSGRGARLLRGELEFGGGVRALAAGRLGRGVRFRAPLDASAHGFTWLRDLRALGTDAARLRARALVAEWIASPPGDAAGASPGCGRRPDHRLARPLRFLRRHGGRRIPPEADGAAGRPTPAACRPPCRPRSWTRRALTALKGLIAAAVALPEHAGFLTRALRFLPQEIARQVLPDGCHAERSPAAQLAALQDLTEIRALLQAAQAAAAPALTGAIERMAPALRVTAARRWRAGAVQRQQGGEQQPDRHRADPGGTRAAAARPR